MFYGGVLGLETIFRAGDRHVFFRAGSTVVLIFNPRETAKPPSPGALPVPSHGAEGPGHLCFSASAAEIKKSYQRLALKYHPDKNDTEEAEELFDCFFGYSFVFFPTHVSKNFRLGGRAL